MYTFEQQVLINNAVNEQSSKMGIISVSQRGSLIEVHLDRNQCQDMFNNIDAEKLINVGKTYNQHSKIVGGIMYFMMMDKQNQEVNTHERK